MQCEHFLAGPSLRAPFVYVLMLPCLDSGVAFTVRASPDVTMLSSAAFAAAQRLTLVHFSAQLSSEPCLTQENTLHTLNTPQLPLNTGYTTPTRTPVPYKALKLS
jgi:hypothetical protein